MRFCCTGYFLSFVVGRTALTKAKRLLEQLVPARFFQPFDQFPTSYVRRGARTPACRVGTRADAWARIFGREQVYEKSLDTARWERAPQPALQQMVMPGLLQPLHQIPDLLCPAAIGNQ